jgi:hypothetical protein
MSNKNRKVRLELARIYGNGCFFLRSGAEDYIEKLGTIRTYKKYKAGLKFKSKKMKIYEDILTLHHLVHRSEGGAASVDNGAIINAIAHQYLHSLPRSQEEIINDYIREWKKQMIKQNGKEVKVVLSDNIDIPFEVQAAELSIDKNNNLILERLRQKERRKEKIEMQKIRKEYEDR